MFGVLKEAAVSAGLFAHRTHSFFVTTVTQVFSFTPFIFLSAQAHLPRFIPSAQALKLASSGAVHVVSRLSRTLKFFPCFLP